MKTNHLILLVFALLMVFSYSANLQAGHVSQKPIKFNHFLHAEDAGMECSECHKNMAELNAGQRAMPDHDVCMDCHDVDDDNECAMCHVNPEEPEAMPAIEGLYEGFAHKTHAKAECLMCHGAMAGEAWQPMIPDMANCQDCHMTSHAALDCGVCHKGHSPEPEDHESHFWAGREHGLEAANATSDCAACHTEASCEECHQGHNRTGTPHPESWKFNHGIEAMWSGSCMDCHETRESCTTCHRSMLPIPHEMGIEYANMTNGGDHAEDAKAFSETCLTCHDLGKEEPTCARCHQ